MIITIFQPTMTAYYSPSGNFKIYLYFGNNMNERIK